MEQEISATKEEPMILADNLVKIYKTAELEVLALQGLDLQVERGELLAIIGQVNILKYAWGVGYA